MNFCFVTCFLFIFTREALPHRGITPHHLLHYIFQNLPWSFAAIIFRGYLPREFAAGICSGNLPQEFAAGICRENLPWIFLFVSKSFFVYVSKSFLYGSKPFLYVSKTFLFVRFSLLTVFLFVTVVAVTGHHN